jgi:hypothetical protein
MKDAGTGEKEKQILSNTAEEKTQKRSKIGEKVLFNIITYEKDREEIKYKINKEG